MVNYCFNKKETFCTLQKDYRLCLQKTDGKVYIMKEEQIPDKNNYFLDLSPSGYITASGVSSQLSNLKHIGFEVTDACNLKCYYCTYRGFYDNYDARKNQYMNIKKAKMLIDFVVEKSSMPANKSAKKEIIVSFYGGEPLLNMDLIMEIVSETKLKENDRVKFKYSMTSNGVLLKKYLPFFVEYDFIILVSLDGSRENDAYRLFHNGKSSFDTVYGNMIYIRDNYPIFFENNINFNAVLHNLNNRHEIFSFFWSEFNKVPTFSLMGDVGIKPDTEKEFDIINTHKQEAKDDILEAKMKKVMDLNYSKTKELQSFIFQYSGNKYNSYNDFLFNKKRFSSVAAGTCFPFSKRLFMTVNNKLLPCEKVGHQFYYGKVTDKGVDINCEEVAEKFNNYCNKLKKLCISCSHDGYCMECMYGIKNIENKPDCKRLINKQGFDENLHKGIELLSNAPELYKRIMNEAVSI
jgi:uncharacterized protein